MKDGEWLKSVAGQLDLIRHAKATAPNLLVSTSGGLVPEPLALAADFILIHLNRTPINLIPERIMQPRSYGKPVPFNEDDKIGKIGAEAARVSIKSGPVGDTCTLKRIRRFPLNLMEVWKNASAEKHNVMAIVRGPKGQEFLHSGLSDFEVRPVAATP